MVDIKSSNSQIFDIKSRVDRKLEEGGGMMWCDVVWCGVGCFNLMSYINHFGTSINRNFFFLSFSLSRYCVLFHNTRVWVLLNYHVCVIWWLLKCVLILNMTANFVVVLHELKCFEFGAWLRQIHPWTKHVPCFKLIPYCICKNNIGSGSQQDPQ